MPEAAVELALIPLLSCSDLLALEEVDRHWKRIVGSSRRWEKLELTARETQEDDAHQAAVLLSRIAVRHGAQARLIKFVNCNVPEAALLRVARLFTGLTRISLPGSLQLSDAALIALVTAAPKNTLVGVHAGKCPLLTDLVLEALAGHHSESLESVNFSRCRLLSTTGVSAFASSCRNIRSLALMGCSAANYLSLQEVAAHCPKLESLLVGGAGNITDVAIMALADKCPRLAELDISRSNPFGLGRGGVSDAAMLHLISKCPQLQQVGLGGQGRLTRAVVDALQQYCPRLTRLDIGGCGRIMANPLGLTEALLGMPSLRDLNLSFTRGLGDEHVSHVVDKCAQLRVVRVDRAGAGAIARVA